jgi:hypothetical protein
VLDYRELNEALELTTMAGEMLAEVRPGRNGRHSLVWLFRQLVFGRGAHRARATPSSRTSCSRSASGLDGSEQARALRAAARQEGEDYVYWLHRTRANGVPAWLQPREGGARRDSLQSDASEGRSAGRSGSLTEVAFAVVLQIKVILTVAFARWSACLRDDQTHRFETLQR